MTNVQMVELELSAAFVKPTRYKGITLRNQRGVDISSTLQYRFAYPSPDLYSGLCVSTKAAETETVPVGIVEQLATIMKVFCLTVTKAAEIMNVSRPSIYSWRSGESRIDKNNQERLLQIYHLAKKWENRTLGQLGEEALTPFPADGQSIVDLLKSDPIDSSEVCRRLDLIESKRLDGGIHAQHSTGPRKKLVSELTESGQSNLEQNIRAILDRA